MPNNQDKRVVVAIHTCQEGTEATVIASLLRDRGIECFQRSSLPQSVYPTAAGGVTLYVDEADAEEAIGIIEERGAN